MNEKYKKYINRIKELIKKYEEEIIPKRKTVDIYLGGFYYSYDKENFDILQKWLISVENILGIIFGRDSLQINRFEEIRGNEKEKFANRIHKIKGLLEGVQEDLENGFLLGQEFIIANEVFDSVLEEAKFFIDEQKNKDIGAMLLRIVLEDAIKRIARKENIDIENKKISAINDELKTKGIFIQTIWRQNQAWIDIGNNASHGKFEEYNLNQVESFYQGLVNFLLAHFN